MARSLGRKEAESAALRRFGLYTGRIADAGVAVAANDRVPLRPALMLHPSVHSSRTGKSNTNLVAREPFEIPALKSGVCSL